MTFISLGLRLSTGVLFFFRDLILWFKNISVWHLVSYLWQSGLWMTNRFSRYVMVRGDGWRMISLLFRCHRKVRDEYRSWTKYWVRTGYSGFPFNRSPETPEKNEGRFLIPFSSPGTVVRNGEGGRDLLLDYRPRYSLVVRLHSYYPYLTFMIPIVLSYPFLDCNNTTVLGGALVDGELKNTSFTGIPNSVSLR